MTVECFGRYEVRGRIGSGGMATIYRATDERLDRVVCIKLLRTTLVEGSGSNNTGGRAVFETPQHPSFDNVEIIAVAGAQESGRTGAKET